MYMGNCLDTCIDRHLHSRTKKKYCCPKCNKFRKLKDVSKDVFFEEGCFLLIYMESFVDHSYKNYLFCKNR